MFQTGATSLKKDGKVPMGQVGRVNRKKIAQVWSKRKQSLPVKSELGCWKSLSKHYVETLN